MRNATPMTVSAPATSPADALNEALHAGARQMLLTAIEAEVAAYVDQYADVVDQDGHRLVVRNGHLPEKTILTGLGPIKIRQPRVLDQRFEDGERQKFNSKILPPYLRKTRSLEGMIPWLYLKGISTGDFSEALQTLLGPDAPGLSATSIVRLKQVWEEDFKTWSRRSLAGKQYAYIWVDGIYGRVRLEDGRPCLLVVIGATQDGRKELLAIQDGERESEQSWKELLLDLKKRGLKLGPQLAIGDGALGFWSAVSKVYPNTRHQRCWVHKSVNVLDKLPKKEQPAALAQLHEIWMAATREKATAAFDHFIAVYEAKYPKATECLEKDRAELLAFYDFPAEHWRHLRTSNPIESTFATIRLRTARTKGSGSRIACLTMVFKLAQVAEKHWRLLNGAKLLKDVMKGIQFKDGAKVKAA